MGLLNRIRVRCWAAINGAPDYDSLPEDPVVPDHDKESPVIKHPKVEELFHWKQEQSRTAGEDVFNFNHGRSFGDRHYPIGGPQPH